MYLYKKKEQKHNYNIHLNNSTPSLTKSFIIYPQ